MTKISYEDYLRLIGDPETTRERLLDLVIVARGEGGLDFEIRPDPEKVDLSPGNEEFENAMKIGNGIDRFRRRTEFRNRLFANPDTPVLVSEGDSWFQFPLLIEDTIDHLSRTYAIWSLGAAGDTAENMVFGPKRSKRTEYLAALRRHKSKVKAFLFSGAGNDIIGEDPTTKQAVLQGLLRPFNGDTADIAGHIDHTELAGRIAGLMKAYRTVITTVHTEPGLEALPIIVHGYDVPYAFSGEAHDTRNPLWADRDQWLGSAFEPHGIMDPGLRRKLLGFLIDRLYMMLNDIAAESDHVFVVDCRGALPSVTDWADEIHGTSAGYATVAARFEATLQTAFASG